METRAKQVVIGVTGASGCALAWQLILSLLKTGSHVHLVLTPAALLTAGYELSKKLTRPKNWIEQLPKKYQDQIQVYQNADLGAKIASGSFHVDATLIVPCSVASLSAIACGLGDNLLRRVADVAIKERRPLLLAPREMPFSPIHLENMLKLARLGVIIAPPVPSWYLDTKDLKAMEEVIVARLMQLCSLPRPESYRSWTGERFERGDLFTEPLSDASR